MNREKIAELYKKYELTKDDVFKHKHYLIITRQGIDKIQAKEIIFIVYNSVIASPEYCVVKASAVKGEVTSLIIQALKEIGKDNVTAEQLEKIKIHLEKEKQEIIEYDAKLAPVWISKIMKNN